MVDKQEQLFRFYQSFSSLDQFGVTIAEYVWIDGKFGIRSKARTFDKKIESIDDLPNWNYDGSSCYQAKTQNSEIILKPVAFYRDPFRLGQNIIVMCESYIWADDNFKKLKPANTNFRFFAKQIFDQGAREKPWFGIEQEYQLLETKNNFITKPLGWPSSGYPEPQGPYYCSVGSSICYGRAVVDAHLKACIYAGLKISGINAEVMPGQWEYQIGPCEGIDIGDQMWVSRYLLHKVAEDFGVTVSFEPKIFPEWNGAGCHTNYSTIGTRAKDGMSCIESIIKKLGGKHKEHLELYGDNSKRLSGRHETSSKDVFSSGVGDRGASVRIPSLTSSNQCGYIEDRRPASDMDPYVVTAAIIDTTLLEESYMEPMVEHYKLWKEEMISGNHH